MAKSIRAEDLRGRTVHVAGMSRGGTTYLYHNLQRHPQVFLPARKEICFFGHNFGRGLDWFLDFYRGIGDEEVALDICGLYFMVDESLDRILEFNPEAKVIVTVRDPYEWIYSIYEHYSTVWDVPPLEEFVGGCVWHRDERDIPLEFTDGKIERTIRRLQERLGKNLLVIDFKLFRSDPLRLLQAIEEFVGIRPWFDEGNFSRAKVNQRGSTNSARLMANLIRIPGVVQLSRFVPRKLLMSVRGYLESDRSGTKKADARPERPTYTPEQKGFVEAALAADRSFVQGLFAESPLLVGTEPHAPRT